MPAQDSRGESIAAAFFRCERFEDALESLVSSGFVNPKDEPLTVTFRAMCRHQLGDAYTSRKLLGQAREGFAAQLAVLDGPELPYQDRAIVWAMVQVALREAEALIGTAQIPADPSAPGNGSIRFPTESPAR